VATDARGLSVSLRVRVTTDATGTLVLGDDATRLTSDARPEFTSATVRSGPRAVDADLVWHTRCGATGDEGRLRAATKVGGLDYAWSVPLAGVSLPALRAAACR